MSENLMMNECLKFSYALISNFVEVLFHTQNENYISLILPIYYYLSEYTHVSDFFFKKFPSFLSLSKKLYINLKKKLENEMALKEELTEDYLENICVRYIFMSEINLLGFLPLESFFKNQKQDIQVF